REALVSLRIVSVPGFHASGRPARVASGVAVGARVWRAQRNGQIRPRNSQAVIVTAIDHHVGGRWHMTANARCAGASRRVVVMAGVVVLTRQVTGGAEGVALQPRLPAVRIVTVAAGDAVRVHLALKERAPVVDLCPLLAVGVVER